MPPQDLRSNHSNRGGSYDYEGEGGATPRIVEHEATEVLAGDQVFELHQFTQKKVWIDEKIEFLAGLPPIDAISPDPPKRSPTSKDQLQEWWKEHDRIEAEVDRYDMGDLAKLKNFAKNASKRHLSARDTDLIEITLATLFSVDKLLHLLRQRKRRLNLLNYRLQWEEHLNIAWAEHRRIFESLPRFLSHARWSIPSSIDSPSRHPSDDPSSSLRRSSILFSPTGLSTSTSSSSISSNQSSSAQSRTMRSEILSLELASHKTKLATFTKTLLPATSNCLDNLIDTSSNPLPDSFLDEQDRLEDDSKLLSEGLGEFLGDLVRQWRSADLVFWNARDVELDSQTINREIEEELLKLPTREKAEGFEERVEGLWKSLLEVQALLGEKRMTEGFLPEPRHGSVRDQEEENRRLVALLKKSEKRAGKELEEAVKGVQKYRLAAETLERSSVVRGEMEDGLKKLREFEEDARKIVDRRKEKLLDLRCLILPLSGEEISSDAKWGQLETEVESILSGTKDLLKRASTVVVDLGKLGIDPNVRRELKEVMEGLMSIRSDAEGSLDEGRKSKLVLDAVRKSDESLRSLEGVVEDAREKTLREVENSRWVESRIAATKDEADVAALVEAARLAVDSSLNGPVPEGRSILHPQHHTTLLSHLDTRSSHLRDSLSSLQRLHQTLSAIKSQTLATTTLLTEVDLLSHEITTTTNDVSHSLLNKPHDSWKDGELTNVTSLLKERFVDLSKRTEELESSTHLRIPFLSSNSSQQPPTSDLPFSLEGQDGAVREAVNKAVAGVSGGVDELRRQLEMLEHLGEAKGWDERLEEVTKDVGVLEDSTRLTKDKFEKPDGNHEAELKFLNVTTESSLASLKTHSDHHLPNLSQLLASLHTSPHSTSPPFNSHLIRDSSLTDLTARITSLIASNVTLAESISKADEDRKRKAAEEAAILSAASALEAETTALTSQINNAVRHLTSLEGQPNLKDESCLVVTLSETEFDTTSQNLVQSLRQHLDLAPSLLERFTALLETIEKSDLLPSVGGNLVSSIEALKTAQSSAEETLKSLEVDRRDLVLARELQAAIQSGSLAVETVRQSLSTERDRSCWRAEGGEVAPLDHHSLINELLHQIDFDLLAPLAAATDVLKGSHTALASHFRSQLATLRSSVEEVIDIGSDITRLRDHSQLATRFLGDVGALDSDLTSLRDQVDDALLVSYLSTRRAELESRAEALTSSASRYSAEATSRVPSSLPPRSSTTSHTLPPSLSSISFSPPSSTISAELVEQHERALNGSIQNSLTALHEHLQEVHGRLAALAHHGEATLWDGDRDLASASLEDRAKELSAMERGLAERDPDDSVHLANLSTLSNSLHSQLTSHSATLAALGTTLLSLQASPTASLHLFNNHLDRADHLSNLQQNHSDLVTSASSLSSSIAEAESARARRVKEAEQRRVQLEETRAAWRTQLASCSEKLEQSHSSLTTIAARVATSANDLVSCSTSIEKLETTRTPEVAFPSQDLLRLHDESSSLDTALTDWGGYHEQLLQESARLEEAANDVDLRAEHDVVAAIARSIENERLHTTEALSSLRSSLAALQRRVDAYEAWRHEKLEERARRLEEERRLEESRLEEERKLAEQRRLAEEDFQRREVEEEEDRRKEEHRLLEEQQALEVEQREADERRLKVSKIQEDARLQAELREEQERKEREKVAALLAESLRLEEERIAEQDRLRLLAEEDRLRVEEEERPKLAVADESQPTSDLITEMADSREHSDKELFEDSHEKTRQDSSVVTLASSEGTLVDREEAQELAQQGEPSKLPSARPSVEPPSLSFSESRTLPSEGEPLEEDFLAAGVRRRKSTGRVPLASTKDLEDIFGPTLYSAPFSDIPADDEISVSNLRDQLNEVNIDRWLDEQTFLQLPLKEDVIRVSGQLATCDQHLEELEQRSSPDLDLSSFRSEIEQKRGAMDRVAALADFHDKVIRADVTLSDLLTSIDASTPGLSFPSTPSRPSTPDHDSQSLLSVSEALLAASNAVSRARIQAIPLVDDVRVNAHIDRIEEAFAEMTQMVDDLGPRSRSQSSASGSSVGSSSSSRQNHTLRSRKPISRESSRPPSRSSTLSRSSSSSRGSMGPPPPKIAAPPLPKKTTGALRPPSSPSTPRARVHSATTISRASNFANSTKASLSKSTSLIPTRDPLSTLTTPRRLTPTPGRLNPSAYGSGIGLGGPNGTPHSRRESTESIGRATGLTISTSSKRKDSLASSTSSTFSRKSFAPSSPVVSRRYSSLNASPRRASSYNPNLTPPPKPKTVYKPNTKRKVDVEVGRIVNSFPISVPIKVADQHAHSDETGMYWIGEVDPKLYFCRILRSRTAMVRIGGGWQELSAFLHSHFASTYDIASLTISPSTSVSSSTLRSSDQRWISSASPSLTASTSSLSIRSVSGGHSPLRRVSILGGSLRSPPPFSVASFSSPAPPLPPTPINLDTLVTPKASRVSQPRWR